MRPAKFYCEHCHRQVRADAKICPHCGRFFSAVRCPVCDYTGSGTEFMYGCPNCGYTGRSEGSENIETMEFKKASGSGVARRPKRREGPPSWVFPLVGGILTLAFLALVLIYFSL